MKNLISYFLIFMLIFTSCSKDDDDPSEPDAEENTETPDSEITATETCLFSDFVIEANSTVK